MTASFIKYAFISGEVSPTLYGRTDLEQYDLGMEKINNWFLDYRGGLSTRPGFELVDQAVAVEERTKFFKFVFGPQLEDTYLIVFDQDVIRFVQDGAYVLEGSKAVTGLALGAITTVTATSHGYSIGDLVYLVNVGGISTPSRLFRVNSTTTNTFTLVLPNGGAFDSTGTVPYSGTGGVAQRVYGVPHPYTSAELEHLRAYQIRDTLRLTHFGRRIRNLTRVDHTNWTLSLEEIGNEGKVPTGLTVTPSASGPMSVGFVVTSFDKEGNESLPSNMKIHLDVVDYTSIAGHATVTWNTVPGARYYKVYRTLLLPTSGNGEVTGAESVGYLGIAYAPRFVDKNIVPDFTQTPPVGNNPFAPMSIEHITVTAGGSGYTAATAVNVSGAGGTGTGFRGFAIVDSGVVRGVTVINGGEGYVSPVTISFTTGTGATATAEISPAGTIHPRVSAVFQQRQIYAGSVEDPLTLWGSRPGLFSNFDISQISAADDSFELEVDSAQVAPIEHLMVNRGGLLVASEFAIWQVHSGDGSGVVSPTNAVADPQNFRGVATNPVPIAIDTDMLHVEGRHTGVFLLGYNDITRVYSGQEVSYLSNHLFPPENPIVAWDWAGDPHKLLWCAQQNGVLVTFTYWKEQQVLYGWAPSSTEGFVTDVCSIPEDGLDRVYLMVKRKLNGTWVKMIERVAVRDFNHIEDAVCVDSSLAYTPVRPAATLTPKGVSGTVNFVADAPVFTAADLNKVLRCGGAKGIVSAVTSPTGVTAILDFDRPVTDFIPETEEPRPCLAGTWSLDTPFTVLRGLWHLIGETVQILADGSVVPEQVVAPDGSITLPEPATRAIVGLRFRPLARTLPLTTSAAVIENRRKRVVEIASRVTRSRGLKWGPTLREDDLIEIKERTDEPYGSPVRLQDGMEFAILNAGFDEGGQVWLVQDNPLPATVTGLILEVEVGDDPPGRRR